MNEKEKKEIRLAAMLQILAEIYPSIKVGSGLLVGIRMNPSLEKWFDSCINRYKKEKFSEELYNEVNTFIQENSDIIPMLLTIACRCTFSIKEPLKVSCSGY